jgi:hypothetical protein
MKESNVFEGEHWIINSEHALKMFLVQLPDMWKKHKHITIKWRCGSSRSLSQNALLHVWLTEYAAKLLNKTKKQVTKGELEGMKRCAKGEFYKETANSWMILTITNPKTGESKKEFTSSKDWGTGGMFDFLTWLQAKAAQDGLILEAKGEFAELVKTQNGAAA